MGEGDPSVRKNSRRAEVTLRGLRITPHKRNPVELHGRTIPWLNVHFREHQGAVSAMLAGENGEWIRRGRSPIVLPLTLGDGHAAKRARKRAQQVALSLNSYDITVINEDIRTSKYVFLFMTALSVAAIMIMGWPVLAAVRSPSQLAAWWAAHGVVGVVALLTMLLILAAPMIVVYKLTRASVARLRVTPLGLEADDVRLGSVRAPWRDVRDIRKDWPCHVLELCDGRRLHVSPGRAAFVLESHSPRALEKQESNELRRALILGLVGCQFLGLTAAYLHMQGYLNHQGGPLAVYLVGALGFPLLAACSVLVPMWLPRVMRWRERTSRTRRARSH